MRDRGRLIAGLTLGVFIVLATFAAQASAFVPNGTHGWYWQLPQPAGSSGMIDLALPTEQDAWSVGDGGLVLHSTDGGASWSQQPTGIDADLWSVDFADALNGAACGDAVLVTHDGGATWSDKTPAASLAAGYVSVSVVDGMHGWVATSDGAVLRTADGGDTWRRVALPRYKATVTCDFLDATHGWAGGEGGRVWRTVDGGATWSLKTIGAGARVRDTPGRLDFVDRHHGWRLDWSYWGNSIVSRTSDGGATWTRARAASWATWIDATSRDSAWIVAGGWWWWGEATILRHTDDGGKHWQSATLSAPASPMTVAAHGKTVCAVGDGVLISSDAGLTWRAASSGQLYPFTDAALSPSGDIWAVEYDGGLVRSTDGARWTEQDVPARWSTSLMGVSFPDATNGWVVGSSDLWGENGVILHTSDGGASWEPQISNLGGRLVGVQFVDSTTGWAISDDPYPWGLGANTCLERTTDGGATWIPLYVANGAALYDLHFLDANTGWAVGWYEQVEGDAVPTVFKTLNGGFTWTKQRLPKDAPEMTSVQFLDADTGCAVGVAYDWDTGVETGWVVTTTDGGKTWTRAPGAESILGTTVRFSDAQHGWIGGDNGIYETSDGGVTWRRVAGGWGFNAIVAADPDHVWAFSMASVVSTVDASGDLCAPATVDDSGYSTWSRKPVTVSLRPFDTGGSGLASTEYKIDGGSWQTGADATVEAPADHANDGQHSLYYRSTDHAGNREATALRTVLIDTLGPACGAPRRSKVNAGGMGILYFSASDATSGVKRVVITIRDGKGRVAKRIVEGRGNWSWDPPRPYYWLRFRCDLAPGSYDIEVRGFDRAGNAQVTVGRNHLRVVRSGAAWQFRPPWPEGLPYDSYGFGPLGMGRRPDAHKLLRGMLMAPSLAYRTGSLLRP